MINQEEGILLVEILNLKLKVQLCDHADAYILVKGTITTAAARDDAAARQGMKEIKMQYLTIVRHLLNA